MHLKKISVLQGKNGQTNFTRTNTVGYDGTEYFFGFYQTGFCHYFQFVMRRCGYMIVTALDQKKYSIVFCFSSAEICFADRVSLFLHQY